MGTAKKLTLTAGVAVLVAFAFMIGFVPAHDAATSRAADSEGRVDMAGLLDMIVGGEKAIEAITPSATVTGLDVNGVNVIVPVTNAEPPTVMANITSLTVNSGPDDQVFYVLNGTFSADTEIDPPNALPYWEGADGRSGVLRHLCRSRRHRRPPLPGHFHAGRPGLRGGLGPVGAGGRGPLRRRVQT